VSRILVAIQLALVEKTREYLELLISESKYRDSLYVPDGSRKIFDSVEKVEALKILKSEMRDLAFAIYKELRPYSESYDTNVILNKAVFLS
jgi:hypothetical protein